jgi:glycosyltransferase involved in cell wall biosynthesis
MPLTEVSRHGHDVKIVIGKDVRVSEAAAYPLVVGERIDKHDALSPWRRLRATAKLVYEIDDDVFNVTQVNWEAYGVYSRRDVQDAVAHAAEVANLVTVTTEPLAEVMRAYNGNVAVLPNYLPAYVADLPRDPGRVVGWAGGASHAHDMAVIAGPVRKFLDRNPAWSMRLQGTDYRPTIRHQRTTFVPWIDITKDAPGFYRAIDWDIGLAPLAPGGMFNRSKSYIKALEYAARGIPVLATDAEPYRDFVIDGVTGFLIRYDHEWLKRLDELANDDVLRTEMGAAARDHARKYVIEDHWQAWQEAYEGVLS